jgi:hypothetical protein
MWILMNDSFISVIASDRDNALLVVRARREGDLQQVFGADIEVTTIPGRDYAYRCFLPRESVGAVIAARLVATDYTNVKGSVKDHWLHEAYMRIWSVLADLQMVRPYATKPTPGFKKHPQR